MLCFVLQIGFKVVNSEEHCMMEKRKAVCRGHSLTAPFYFHPMIFSFSCHIEYSCFIVLWENCCKTRRSKSSKQRSWKQKKNFALCLPENDWINADNLFVDQLIKLWDLWLMTMTMMLFEYLMSFLQKWPNEHVQLLSE